MNPKLKILFVCALNKKRSVTAERVFREDPRVEVRSAGVRSEAPRRVSAADLAWADVVFAMEREHKQIAGALTQLGLASRHERDVTSPNGTVRADVFTEQTDVAQSAVISELKVYSPENTIPSQIRDAVRTTLKRHTQFAGYLQRQ